jgi:hypothetical protein
MDLNHIKEIKRRLRKQIKREYPGFKDFKRKQKKGILDSALQQIIDNYDISQPVTTDSYELCGVEHIPEGVYTLDQIEEMYKKFTSGLLSLKLLTNKTAIKDPELQFINQLCDWPFVNKLLEPKNYSHAHREIYPVQLFKAELLKSLKYPELSYRKYCDKELNNKERKENRAFIGLRRGDCVDHSQLSTFRSSMSYYSLINVMVYFISIFLKNKKLSRNVVYAVDSTELAEKISPYPLVKIKFNGQEIRFYQDIDADCGTRRQKRDKSMYIVGYRLHTLTVIDPETKKAYPLLSILASANHHDSHFLQMLVELGKTIGLDLNIVIGDQAYGKANESEIIQKKHNVTILNQPKEIKKLPQYVNPDTYDVYMNDFCDTPMQYKGKDNSFGHEYHCAAEAGECPYLGACTQIRHIPVDTGVFGQIPYQYKEVQKLCKMRKVAERPFNLLKHREGLEPLRTLSSNTTRTVTVIANIATLLIEIAGYRHKKKMSKNTQIELFSKAA